MPKLPIKNMLGERQERCLYCSGTKIIKKGKRRKKFETLQLWYCKDCDHIFTPRALRGKTYPIPVILDGSSYYHFVHSLQDSSMLLQERYGIRVTPTTLSRWLREYQPFCTYARLRTRGMELFPPHRLIQATRLHHNQVYHYRIHKAKLALLLEERQHRSFRPLETYLTEMVTACPHRLFRDDAGRGSNLKVQFDIDGVSVLSLSRGSHGLPSLASWASNKTHPWWSLGRTLE